MKRITLLGNETERSIIKNSLESHFGGLCAVTEQQGDILCLLPGCKDWYETAENALLGGQSVYLQGYPTRDAEKLRALAALASRKGAYFGGGSDIFLGAALQTARKLIDEGFIGVPLGAQARKIRETGEVLSCLINLLGRVTGMSVMPGKAGETLSEKDPGVRGALLHFADESVCQLLLLPELFPPETGLEICGTEGALRIGDPAGSGGEVSLFRAGQQSWCRVPMMFCYDTPAPGLGLAEMAESMEEKRPHRAGAGGMIHVTEILGNLYADDPGKKELRIRSPFRRGPAMKLSEPIGRNKGE